MDVAVAPLRRSISCSRRSIRRIFDALAAIGHGIAGSPATRARLSRATCSGETGVNYVLCQMMFGDMNFADAAHSIELFAREVMPAFK